MALTYDLSKIKDKDNVCWEKDDDGTVKMKAETHVLIFTTMSAGMPRITEKNFKEFFVRCDMLAQVFGAPMTRPLALCSSDGTVLKETGKEDIKITLDNVRAHIGLATNAASRTTADFNKGLCAELKHRATTAFLRQAP